MVAWIMMGKCKVAEFLYYDESFSEGTGISMYILTIQSEISLNHFGNKLIWPFSK